MQRKYDKRSLCIANTKLQALHWWRPFLFTFNIWMVVQACILYSVYLKQPKEREGRSERRGWFWESYSLPSQSDRNFEVHR